MSLESVIIAAYSDLAVERRCSADDVLIDPDLRGQFLDGCRRAGYDRPERELLRGLVTVRKRGRLPRLRDLADPPAAGA